MNINTKNTILQSNKRVKPTGLEMKKMTRVLELSGKAAGGDFALEATRLGRQGGQLYDYSDCFHQRGGIHE